MKDFAAAAAASAQELKPRAEDDYFISPFYTCSLGECLSNKNNHTDNVFSRQPPLWSSSLFPRPDALSYILITVPYAQPFLAVLALSLNPDLTKTPAFSINIINTHKIYTTATTSVVRNENKYEFICSKILLECCVFSEHSYVFCNEWMYALFSHHSCLSSSTKHCRAEAKLKKRSEVIDSEDKNSKTPYDTSQSHHGSWQSTTTLNIKLLVFARKVEFWVSFPTHRTLAYLILGTW